MVAYATIGTNDLESARSFYDPVVATLGGKRTIALDRMQFYGGVGQSVLALCKPYDGG